MVNTLKWGNTFLFWKWILPNLEVRLTTEYLTTPPSLYTSPVGSKRKLEGKVTQASQQTCSRADRDPEREEFEYEDYKNEEVDDDFEDVGGVIAQDEVRERE
ncbi:hypothetical protein BT69DRAFT_1342646 [Atractiella rhizophila]|nr:hypothetical protein BT69DRAFT_1342646 [Atractiella rhizophila]